MNTYKELIQEIQSKWFLVTVAMLPMPQGFARWAIVIWYVLWLMEGRWLQKPKALRENTMCIPVLFFGVWYLLKLVSGLWAADTTAWLAYMERHATFAALIPVGIWGVSERYDFRKICVALVTGCVVCSVLYPFTLYWVYNHEYFIPQAGWGERKALNMCWYADKVSYMKHRLFLCAVEVVGIIAAVALRKPLRERYGRTTTVLVLSVSITAMLTTIILTGSRQTLITIAGLAMVAVYTMLSRQIQRKWRIGLVVAIALLGVSTLHYHPRMEQFNRKDIGNFMQVEQAHDIRLNIWGFALSSPEDYLRNGLGAGQVGNYLTEKYTQAQWTGYLNRGYDSCHNQYLTELMENGIGGLVWFLLCWVSLVYFSRGNGRINALFLTTIYALNMCTDSMFGRYDGIALWSVWMVVMIAHANGMPNLPEHDGKDSPADHIRTQ